jgi:Flp pilus assembly protein TadB
MPVLLVLGALLAMLAFIVWERRRSASSRAAPLTRASLEKGWSPKQIPMWSVSAGFSFLFGVRAFVEWRQPKSPPFAGRWSEVISFFHAQFGVHGVAYLWAALAVVLLLLAALQYRSGAEGKLAP